MCGRGTIESIAILALVDTFIDQYRQQADMTDHMQEMLEKINLCLADAWACWPEKIPANGPGRIENKLERLARQLPMDQETDIVVMTSFVLSTLEDFAQKVKHHKRMVINKLILSILELHEYYADQNNADFDHLIYGSHAADAWQMEAIR